jgi:hypothetical protein
MIVDSRIYEVAVAKDGARFILADGRTIMVPLEWFPALAAGSPAAREHYAIEEDGAVAVWPDLGERVSVEGLMLARRPPEG